MTVQEVEREDVEEVIKAAIQAVEHLPVEVELVGFWVWLSGDTKPYRAELKAAGYRWAPKKARWYFPTVPARSRGRMSMPEIRARHGSTWVRRGEEQSP